MTLAQINIMALLCSSLRYVVPELNVVPTGEKIMSETTICDVMKACINIYSPCIIVILVLVFLRYYLQ